MNEEHGLALNQPRSTYPQRIGCVPKPMHLLSPSAQEEALNEEHELALNQLRSTYQQQIDELSRQLAGASEAAGGGGAQGDPDVVAQLQQEQLRHMQVGGLNTECWHSRFYAKIQILVRPSTTSAATANKKRTVHCRVPAGAAGLQVVGAGFYIYIY